MFSTRTRWDRTPNRLHERLESLRQTKTPILDLTLSNPTRAGLSYDPETLAALGNPAGLHYDATPRGLSVARTAIAASYTRSGVELSAEDLILTASTSEAYAFLFKLLTNPGDTVLVPQPSYPLFEFLATLEGVRLRPYPLVYDGRWQIDLDALRAASSEDVRAIIVVHPNNPTGSFLKKHELETLRELGRPIVSDEVFLSYAAGPDPTRVGSLAGETGVLAFALGGLSKSCGLPQLKLGWIAIAGPEALRREAQARLELIADTYLSVGTPVQLAAPRLLASGEAFAAQVKRRVSDNRRVLLETLGSDSPGEVLRAEGGWSVIVRVPRTRSEEEWGLELLERDHVHVHPGYFFDFESEAYLVLSLLTEPAEFSEGAKRLAKRIAA